MKRLKGYSLTWWITQLLGIILYLSIVVFEIVVNKSLFFNESVTIDQKIVNIVGIFLIYYSWYFIVESMVNSIRNFIRKQEEKRFNNKKKEKYKRIKKQMENSVSHIESANYDIHEIYEERRRNIAD